MIQCNARIGYAARVALLCGLLGITVPAQAAINYLVVSVVNSSYQITSTKELAADWFCSGVYNSSQVWRGGSWLYFPPNPGPQETSVTSGSIVMSFAITTTLPPAGAPVHIFGNAESMTTNPANNVPAVYIAGVPSTLNITTLATGSSSTVTLGGSPVQIDAISTFNMYGAAPGIGLLLPDKTVVTATVTGTITQNYTAAYSAAGSGCWSGNYYESGTRRVSGSASLLFGAGSNVMSQTAIYDFPQNQNGIIAHMPYVTTFQQGLSIIGSNFTITDSNNNKFVGAITHAIGY